VQQHASSRGVERSERLTPIDRVFLAGKLLRLGERAKGFPLAQLRWWCNAQSMTRLSKPAMFGSQPHTSLPSQVHTSLGAARTPPQDWVLQDTAFDL
jgi:hypothetical protein